jgi:hypothetical protein
VLVIERMNKIFIVFLLIINASVYAAGNFNNCHIVEIVSAGDVNAHVSLDCTWLTLDLG